jgi:hypothetical protein
VKAKSAKSLMGARVHAREKAHFGGVIIPWWRSTTTPTPICNYIAGSIVPCEGHKMKTAAEQ